MLFYLFIVIAKCNDLLQIQPPPETFNRWLYEQLSQDPSHITTDDPVLRWPESALETEVVRRELTAVMPCRMRSLTKDTISDFYQYG